MSATGEQMEIKKNENTLRGPNSEQKAAIEHKGGVLLAAGAGSGKTFVLVEHIIFLVNTFLDENKEKNDEELETLLKSYFSKIVMMTFTNKAAGELAIRIKERFLNEIKYNPDIHPRFKLAETIIENMTVGTIHGFCFKLLNQGFFPNIAKGVEIINDLESSTRIEKLSRGWLETLEQNDDIKKEIKDIFYRHYSELILSLKGVFENPDLRLTWSTLNIDEALEINLDEIFKILLHENGLLSVFDETLSLGEFDNQKEKKWYQFLREFEMKKSSFDFSTLDGYVQLREILKQLKTVRAPGKIEGTELVKEKLQKIREVNKLLLDLIENFEMYLNHKDDFCRPQIDCFKQAFDYISEKYFEQSGLTFSDLEYLVLKGLEDDSVKERISSSYNYFIIDEFQDTSEVQFEIVSRLLGGNYSRLFCVGDMKQAIYGFRGGELGVFKACMKLMDKNLSMKNNYRSSSQIINFNNALFKDIFPKSYKYKGREKESVLVEPQSFPTGSSQGEGALYKIQVCLDDGESPLNSNKTNQIDYAEAKEILKQIKKIKEKDGGQICVLYKKLSPSNHLIAGLIKENIGFTAQIKIPAKEDFILGLFSILVSLLRNKEFEKTEFLKVHVTLLNAYLESLGIKKYECLRFATQEFMGNVNAIGVYDSFKNFLYDINLSNSNFENNLLLIEKIVNLSYDDLEEIQSFLEKNYDQRYSIDFKYGNDSSDILIMTAHASKGLEFRHVILGGIHSNSRRRASDSFLGKSPGSFKWKLHSSQKKPFLTPQLLKEKAIEKRKDFQESKRLFYVACTRAISTLSWVDLKGSKSSLGHGGESWVDGVRSFEEDLAEDKRDVLKFIKDHLVERETSWAFSDEEVNSLKNNPPFFHLDELGNYEKINAVDSGQNSGDYSSLGILSELSVTRLARLAECPRKFFLLNVLKLEGNELDYLEEEKVLHPREEIYSIENNKAEEETCLSERLEEEISFSKIAIEKEGKSSAERGTLIHQALHETVLGDLILPANIKRKNDIAAVSFGIELLSLFSKAAIFISEVPLKFSFFNFMISGTPDLVILDKKDNQKIIEVWDYKTGQNKNENFAYQLQLMCYAYGCMELGYCSRSDEIILKLIFLDQKEVVDFKYTYSQLREELYQYWKKVNCPDETNPLHCPSCQFGNMCPEI